MICEVLWLFACFEVLWFYAILLYFILSLTQGTKHWTGGKVVQPKFHGPLKKKRLCIWDYVSAGGKSEGYCWRVCWIFWNWGWWFSCLPKRNEHYLGSDWSCEETLQLEKITCTYKPFLLLWPNDAMYEHDQVITTHYSRIYQSLSLPLDCTFDNDPIGINLWSLCLRWLWREQLSSLNSFLCIICASWVQKKIFLEKNCFGMLVSLMKLEGEYPIKP